MRPGSLTGFLGPNGAGKSTTMRMLVGLTPPSAGYATVLGVPYAQLPNPGRHVGVLLDASAQHTGRTGREVLRLGAMVMGLDDERVDDMLDAVGLSRAEAGRRTGTYSLGMRQRLGVAHTNDDIARQLLMSPATAKTHVSRAMIKLRARDRAQLVVIAYESGLVRPGWLG